MKIQIHDFGGYPFVSDLTEHLVARGHAVDHVYSSQYSSNTGDFISRAGPEYTVSGLAVRVPAEKYSIIGRFRFERAYAHAWLEHTDRSRPDLVVCANVPLVVLGAIARWCESTSTPWVLWHQDVVSMAMAGELRRRLPTPLARLGARLLEARERGLTRRAGAVVAIGKPFEAVYKRWRISPFSVVENWAPLLDVRPGTAETDWTRTHLPGSGLPRLLYAGTLGRKHRPALLLDLARELDALGRPVQLVVVSEGPAAEGLRTMADSLGRSQLTLLPFQDAVDLPDVLASADLLVALLEPEAAAFSVPSKVLTYLAAGRPVVGLMPRVNAAAATVMDAGGHVSDPTASGVVSAAKYVAALLEDPESLARVGRQSRTLVEGHFSAHSAVRALGDTFEMLVQESSPM